MMVIVPVNADIEKTQYIAAENRKDWLQSLNTSQLRNLQLKNHDSDDDCQDSIAEGLEPTGLHGVTLHDETSSLKGNFNRLTPTGLAISFYRRFRITYS